MYKEDRELKKELTRHISIIMIGILCIPVIVIFLLIQQSIYYNSLYKENIGKDTERVAAAVSAEIQESLEKYTQLMSIWPSSKEKSKDSDFYNLMNVEDVYFFKNKVDEKNQLSKLCDDIKYKKSFKEGINLITSDLGGKIIIKQSFNTQKTGSISVLGESYFKTLDKNKKFQIYIFNEDKELIYNNNSLEKDRIIQNIINKDKFDNYFNEKILGKQGYSYYDSYGKYGRQTIISYAPLKNHISSSIIGSVVVFRETSKLIPEEKNVKIALFIAMFVGGTILIKLIFKFSEIIIVQFIKITERFNQASKEKEAIRKKLLISEKLASLGRITSGIAHEIGNPLSSILSITQILMSYDLSKEKSREFIARIQKDVLRIDSLIKEFLYFHRNRKENYELLNMNELLESAIVSIPDNRKDENVKLYKDFSKNLPDILGSKKKLEIALTNVILNAFQATERGGMIYLRTTKQNAMVCIRIKDTGSGIGEQEINKIFDPFYTTKEVGQGFGLGLFICQQIIEAHNGNIEVLSEEGKGTEFIIRLPFAENGGEGINDG
ncbi:ATP-binding protein [Wukongibacter baidiensis]|uniref:sensor histidine kinase n=1 Tax=Wukongibacter baidiensis TaxID=1723361 RepID=UPI003D7F3BDF